MLSKTTQIDFCTEKIKEILDYLRPDNKFKIVYAKPEEVNMSDWKREYLRLLCGEDYFIVCYDDEPLYAINVTGDSVLTAIRDLVNLLANKF